MKKKQLLQKAGTVITSIAITLAPLAMSLPQTAYAASLTDVTVALTDEAASATDNVVITFTPSTPITTGSVLEISYDEDTAGPDGFDGGAALLDADIAVTGTNITASAESGFADGYFLSTITSSAPVTTTVTITIDGANELTNPTASGNFNVSVVANIGGTGTTYDYGAGLAYVDDDNDVLVTAVVPPVIDLELYQTGLDAELVDNNSCDLGVLSINQVKECNYDIGFATNNTTGLTVQVIADDDLNNAGDTELITDVADAAVTAGSEEYGFQITNMGAGCSAAAAGTFDSQDNTVPDVPTDTNPVDFIVTTDVCNGTTAAQAAKRAEVTHRASMDTDTVVGTYDQLVTYTAYTN